MKLAFHPLQSLSALALCCVTCGTALAQQDAHEQALRELNIMRNIFGAALVEDGTRGPFPRSAPDALYLAEQGMVFTFNLPGGDGANWFMPGMEALNNLSALNENFDFNFDFDFDFDYEGFGGSGAAPNEQAAAYREQLSDMNEQLRDRQQDLRDVQRELRQLQRQNGEDNANEIARLQDQLATQSTELENFSSSYSQLQQEFEAERAAAVAQRQDQQSSLIFDTLCIYGNTLRTLASNQHVSLVLRNFDRSRSRIYVLDQADVASCTSADSLKASATSYDIAE